MKSMINPILTKIKLINKQNKIYVDVVKNSSKFCEFYAIMVHITSSIFLIKYIDDIKF